MSVPTDRPASSSGSCKNGHGAPHRPGTIDDKASCGQRELLLSAFPLCLSPLSNAHSPARKCWALHSPTCRDMHCRPSCFVSPFDRATWDKIFLTFSLDRGYVHYCHCLERSTQLLLLSTRCCMDGRRGEVNAMANRRSFWSRASSFRGRSLVGCSEEGIGCHLDHVSCHIVTLISVPNFDLVAWHDLPS